MLFRSSPLHLLRLNLLSKVPTLSVIGIQIILYNYCGVSVRSNTLWVNLFFVSDTMCYISKIGSGGWILGGSSQKLWFRGPLTKNFGSGDDKICDIIFIVILFSQFGFITIKKYTRYSRWGKSVFLTFIFYDFYFSQPTLTGMW